MRGDRNALMLRLLGLLFGLLLLVCIGQLVFGQRDQYEPGSTAAGPRRVSRAAKAALRTETGKPYYLPDGCSFLQLKHMLRADAPFFAFTGAYPTRWPSGLKLPSDCRLLLSSAPVMEETGPGQGMYHCYAKGITKLSPQKLRREFNQQCEQMGWELEAHDFVEAAQIPGTLSQPGTWHLRLGNWAPEAEAETMVTGSWLDAERKEHVPSGEYWSLRDVVSISIDDYKDLKGWTYFELIYKRSQEKRWVDEGMRAEYYRRMEEWERGRLR